MQKYKIDGLCILLIEDKAINKMIRYCQKQGMNESGGILLGKVREDYSEIIITDISEPSKFDKSGKYYFIRNKENAQKIINKNWNESNGEVNYLGEWHTHREYFPTPSFTDKRLLSKCIKKNYYTFGCLFLIIVGITGDLYVGYRTNKMKRMKLLEKIEN